MSEENYRQRLEEINALGEYVSESPFDLRSAIARGVLEYKFKTIHADTETGKLTQDEATNLRTAIHKAINPQ